MRVRITDEHFQILECLIKSKTAGESISDAVRFLISQQKRKLSETGFELSTSAYTKLNELAEEVNRTPEQVMADCIDAVVALVDGQQLPPLIVEEINLRRKYRTTVTLQNSRDATLQPRSAPPT